jgi:class 3 adenylate cyclase
VSFIALRGAVDIRAWLRDLGLERYEEAFQENEIDAKILPKLTADDLKDIGVTTVGHRRKLLEAIAALAEPAVAPQAEPSAPADVAPRARRAEAERRQLTVMLVDLVGSTALSARLDPEDMGQVIRSYQVACAEVVERWGGHVAKYMGDGVLAYFGWPQAHEDEAERAVQAGLALIDALAGLEATAGEPLAARVGIATGLVMVGELIGEGAAREEAVVGETPNLAARLQTLAAPGSVVISQATRRLVGGVFELADLGPQRLKGFAEPLAAWRVGGEVRAEGRFEARQSTGLTPLVGRDEEIALLLRRWQQVKDGEGHVVLLSGEPGIGKSRLVREVRARLQDEPHVRLLYQCSPHHTTSPLYPLIEQLERAAGFARDELSRARLDKLEALLARGTDRLDQAVPLIAALLGVSTEGRSPALDLTPQRQKQLTLAALIEQLEGLAAAQPVLLAYEDMHWSDPTTQELLGLTIERLQRLPVLLLITYRPEFSPPWPAQPHVSVLALSRLGRREGAALVERVVRDKPLPDEVAAQIVARTDGVPLFVEELTKTVLESGLLRDAGERYELAGSLPPLAIPSTLHDSLLARLDRLAPVKEIAQIGAAIGREFSHALLAAVADRPEAELRPALDQLVSSELVFRRGTPPKAAYSFKHALVQDAAYGTLLKSRRRQLHARIAAILEARFPEVVKTQPEVLAHHCSEAGLIEKAVGYWQQAGQLAIRRSAMAEAITQLRRGLDLLGLLHEGGERDQLELSLQSDLGGALLLARGYANPETEAAFRRALKLSRKVDDRAHRFSSLRGLISVFHVRAQLRDAERLGTEIMRLAQEVGRSDWLSEAHHAVGVTNFHLGRPTLAEAALHAGIATRGPELRSHLSQAYPVHIGVFCHAYLAHCAWLLGHPKRALEHGREAVEVAHAVADPFSTALAFNYVAMLHQFRREPQAARYAAESSGDVCTKWGFTYYGAWSEIVQGWAIAAEGDLDLGISTFVTGLDRLRSTGAQLRLPCYLGWLAVLNAQLSHEQDALHLLANALAIARRSSEHWWSAELHRLAGEFLIRQRKEDTVRMEARFRQGLAMARRQGARSLELRAATSLARLWAEQGRRAEAHDLLAPVYGWFTEGFDTPDLKDAKALLDELR